MIVFTGHGEASESAKVTCEIVGEHGESGTLALSRCDATWMQHAACNMQHAACCSATAADAEQSPFRKFGRDVFEFRMGSIGAVTQVTLHLDEPSRFFGSKMGWSVTAMLRARCSAVGNI